MIAAVVLGLLVGSFLNVCIYRLPRRESVAWPASHCPSCRRELSWYENVPLASWLVLRGRCRTCRTPISIQYPIVEAVTGALFGAAYYWYGPTALGVVRTLFGCAMIVLFVIDLEHRILPNVITVPGTVIGLVLSVVLPPGWMSSLIGVLVGGGLLFVMGEAYYRLRGVEGLGMGDVKMLAMIGAFLGWRQVWVVLFLASVTGAAIGLAVMAGRGRSFRTRLPFGTFLAVAAFAASLTGEAILDWYLGLFG